MLSITFVILALLMLAIASLLVARAKGKQIPLTVVFVLSFFAICLSGVIAFIRNGENYDAFLYQTWAPLDVQSIPTLVAQGKTVVVDIQADWCLPCRANKANVWHREPVVNTLSADNIVLMRGDLTKPNPTIEAYLASNNAKGTPFNMIYGPSHPQGIALPLELEIKHVYQALQAVR